MADDPHNTSDISDQAEPTVAAKEDAETTAARRELKQTSISEKAAQGAVPLSQDDKSASEDDGPTDKPAGRRITPEIDLGPPREDEGLREQVSSPKKKRAHDELDESRIEEGSLDDTSATTAPAAQSRTDRSEPEKKRPRDGQEPLSGSTSPRSSMEQQQQPSEPKAPASASTSSFKAEPPKQTSASAFAASGFAKLAASSTSPFGSFGGAGGNSPNKPSLFGSAAAASSSLSPSSVFGGGSNPSTTSSAAAAPPKLTFGGGSGSSSPFASAGLNGGGGSGGSVFGAGAGGAGLGGSSSVFKSSAASSSSPFASAFGGSALSGPRLTSFGGKPGEALKSGKPARPFGAPESEDEDEDGEGEEGGEEEEGGSNGGGGEGDEDGAEEEEGRGDGGKGGGGREEEGRGEEGRGEDKKKPRLQKIVVDDGEGQEVTLFSVRAKMYVMEKGVGWKERGGGMLKVNVPKATVELDDQTGQADPASFDPSVLDDEDDEADVDNDEEAQGGERQSASRRHVRLIMRQDHTLRVILNTIILPAMKFQVTNRLKTSTVLFTAFEGNEVRQVQMKLSEVNATAFSNLVEMLKKRLADV